MAVNNAQVNAYLAKTGNLERAEYNKRHPDKKAEVTPPNGIMNSVVWADVPVSAKDFVDNIDKDFPNASKEEKEALKKSYGKIDSTDAFGVITMDAAREWEIRTGDDDWNNEKDAMYAKLARGESLTPDESVSAINFFPQIKIRQTGYVYDEESGRFAPIDYKLSLMRLLPNVIKGSSWEVIRDNMLRQNTAIGTYKTASKHSSITNDGKHNQMYNADGSVNTGDYTLNPIHLEYTFEVVTSPDHFKELNIYPTQRRALLFSNSFEGGVPVDYKGQDWNNLTEAARLDTSTVYRLSQVYGHTIEQLINTGKERLLKKLDAAQEDDGTFTINQQKLSDLLEREFTKRNLPQNVKLSVQTVNGKRKYSLDASLTRETIEQVLISIVDNRLRRQKVPGESLIMASATGMEPIGMDRVTAWNGIDGSDLAYYKKEGRTLPDGTKVTSAMKMKLAMQGDFKKLLNHPDVKKLVWDAGENKPLAPIDALNILIKDEEWLDKGEHRALVTVME